MAQSPSYWRLGMLYSAPRNWFGCWQAPRSWNGRQNQHHQLSCQFKRCKSSGCDLWKCHYGSVCRPCWTSKVPYGWHQWLYCLPRPWACDGRQVCGHVQPIRSQCWRWLIWSLFTPYKLTYYEVFALFGYIVFYSGQAFTFNLLHFSRTLIVWPPIHRF